MTRWSLLPLLLAIGCAHVPTLQERLGPPPTGPVGSALALAPLKLAYVPTAHRPRFRRGQDYRSYRSLRCATCEEELPPIRGELPACLECGGGEFVTSFSRPYRPALDTARISDTVGRVLGQRGGYQRVIPLQRPDRKEAVKAGARLLLEIELEDVKVDLIDHNWLLPVKVANLILSSILIFPAVDPVNWFLPGEDYGVVVHARWRLLDLGRGGATVGKGELKAEVQDSFAAFWPAPSRGWFVVGFLRVPSCLEEDDWRDIYFQLSDQAHDALVAAIVRTAERAAGKVAR